MSNSLTGLNYFLFDNITPTSHGRDWGIKASTGVLEHDKKLKEMFYSYCRLIFETSPGNLGKFGHAIGGFNSPNSHCYILCVIIENKDHVGRSSLAVIGIYFEKYQDLLAFLTEHDPIQTAKQIFEQPTLPVKLPPIPADGKGAVPLDKLFSQWEVKKRDDTAFLSKFETTQSSKLAVGVLAGCINNSMRPPSILGITTHLNTALIKKAGIDIAFCKSDNPSTASLLDRIIENQTNMAGKPRPEIQKTTQSTPVGNTFRQRVSPTSSKRRMLIFFIIGFLILFAILVRITMILLDHDGSTPQNIEPKVIEISDQSEKPAPSKSIPPNGEKQDIPGMDSWDEFLNRTRELLDQLDALNPGELKQSSIYKTMMEVKVCHEHQGKRNTILNFIDELPNYRARLVELNLKYFYEGEPLKESAQKRSLEIKKNIQALNLPCELCKPLELGFKYEFRKNSDVLVKWYTIISSFRELAK